MANHKSALKRHRQSLVRRARNRAAKTRIKNAVKQVRLSVQEQNLEEAKENLRTATSVLQKYAGKKVIHKNNASRRIARLSAAVAKLRSAVQSEGQPAAAEQPAE